VIYRGAMRDESMTAEVGDGETSSVAAERKE
jgi:hypothetical protein